MKDAVKNEGCAAALKKYDQYSVKVNIYYEYINIYMFVYCIHSLIPVRSEWVLCLSPIMARYYSENE